MLHHGIVRIYPPKNPFRMHLITHIPGSLRHQLGPYAINEDLYAPCHGVRNADHVYIRTINIIIQTSMQSLYPRCPCPEMQKQCRGCDYVSG